MLVEGWAWRAEMGLDVGFGRERGKQKEVRVKEKEN